MTSSSNKNLPVASVKVFKLVVEGKVLKDKLNPGTGVPRGPII